MTEYLERDFWKLYKHIMYTNRFIYSDEISKIINSITDFFKEREDIIPVNSLLYRAQKGCNYDDEGIEIPFESERMYPIINAAREGRANPKGISYLYLANKKYIAISEVRSWIGEHVSLASFINNKDLKVIDFSQDKNKSLIIDFQNLKLLSNNTIESTFAEINNAFSKPVKDSDDHAEYSITQMIAELVKSQGYDGLYYNSGYSKKKDEGKNLVIFDRNLVDLHKISIYKIEGINIDFEECNNPVYYKID